MAQTMMELIKRRRSVRTFSGRPSAQDMRKLQAYVGDISSPFGISVEFRILDAEKYGLKSPVIAGTDLYLAAKCRNEENCGLSVGWCFEEACLRALSLNIGTVMLGGTMNRDAFEKAMDLCDDEVMPVVSPLGYIAEKMSLRESLMRKGTGADQRKPFEELFFADSFDHALKRENAGIFADALEALRLAPSAVNHQPWRAVICPEGVHFFLVRSMKEGRIDLQKTDLGIALCHFDLVMKEQGYHGTFRFSDSGLKLPQKTEYTVSYYPV